MSVVNRFFELEFDEDTRRLLLDAIHECEMSNEPIVRSFDFNVHKVTIDGQEATAKVEDDLDPTDDGEETWPLNEFADAVRKHASSDN